MPPPADPRARGRGEYLGPDAMKALLLLPLLAACAWTYKVDRAAQDVPQLTLLEVSRSRSSTKLTFRYATDETRQVGVAAPGQPGAFALTSVDGAQSWPLEKVAGIAELPERTTVEPGEPLEFTLTFAEIPDDLRLFDVAEGEYEGAEGESRWGFQHVRLRAAYPWTAAEHGE